MKNYSFAFLVLVVFSSCSKDDCTSEGFLGTWKGPETCTGVVTEETVVVTGSGDKLVLDGGIFVSDPVTRDDCSFEGGVTVFGVGNKITGELSVDGKTLTITNSTGVGVAALTCTYVLTK